MKYGYVFLERAQKEYGTSVKWYGERSVIAAENFFVAVDKTIKLIGNNPDWWRNQYKNFYELGIKKFPFKIIYFIEENKKQVVITSVFIIKENLPGNTVLLKNNRRPAFQETRAYVNLLH